MLPSLATLEDIEILAPDLDFDEAQTERLLSLASTIVRREAGRNWVDEQGDLSGVPDGISDLVASVVIRLLRSPDDGVMQRTLGSLSESYARDVVIRRLSLTGSEQALLRLLVHGPARSAFTISTYGG